MTTFNQTHCSIDAPETATKPKKQLKQRGRKGNKIVKAFENIPSVAVDFEEYANIQQVSPNVLKQIKRHDQFSSRGKVFIRKNKHTRTMMIWRAS